MSCTAVSAQHGAVRLQPPRLKMARIFLRWCSARRCVSSKLSSCASRHCASATSEDGWMAMHAMPIGAVVRLMPTQADHRATAAMPGSPSPRPPNGPAAAAAAAAERRNGSNSARLQALLRGQGTGLANPFTANGYEVSQVGQDSRVARSAEKNKFLYFSGRPGGPEIQGGHMVLRWASRQKRHVSHEV